MIRSFYRVGISVVVGLALFPSAATAAQKWIRVSSAHFAVLTDAGESKGTEVALRFEQMRSLFGQLLMKNRLNLSEPLDLIALASDAEYFAAAPLRQGQAVSNVAFLLPGDDRNYIVLNLAAPDSWRAVQYQFAHILLRYNYPPAPSWFDEGLTAYFSSLDLGDKQSEIGGDPNSFIEILSTQPWMPLSALFSASVERDPNQPRPPRDLFHAQAWLLMHYLISENKLSETGTCLGYLELQKQPLPDAIQKAYGISATELEQLLKGHFKTLAGPPPMPAAKQKAAPPAAGVTQFTPTLGRHDVGSSRRDVRAPEAEALVAEMMLRVPEHRAAARQKLETLVALPDTDTAIAHRALGWAELQTAQGDKADAEDELRRAIEFDSRDPWAHYYLALMKYRGPLGPEGQFKGLPNMMQDLEIAIDWDSDFAEAYNMLAVARLQGGGSHAAMDAIRVAIQLSPRDQNYLLNLAQIEMAGKQWDAATALLQRLSSGKNPKVAAAAREYLDDLPTLKKYGLMPQRPGVAAQASDKSQAEPKPVWSTTGKDTPEPPQPVEQPARPDTRKTQYLRGKLLSVDCSTAPAATLTVLANGRKMKLRTGDYKSLVLVGSDEFSCDWRDEPVIVNYKVSGKTGGDLVSLEIRQQPPGRPQ